MEKTIKITGARENNLKNVDLTIPRDKLCLPDFRVREKVRLRLTQFLQRDNDAIWSRSLPMQGSSWDKCKSQMLTTSRGFLLQLQLTKKQHRQTHVQLLEQSLKFMTICVCFLRTLAFHIVQTAICQ